MVSGSGGKRVGGMVGGVRGSVRMDVCSGAGGCVGSPDALVYEASMVQEALVGRQRM